VVEGTIGHPNPVLLVDSKVKRRLERLARLRAITLANNTARGQIPRRLSSNSSTVLIEPSLPLAADPHNRLARGRLHPSHRHIP
jgi:hypothetical protein